MAAPPTLAPIVSRLLSGSIAVGDHPTDERIINAVIDELQRCALPKLALEDVARRAGVSRMTVYRRFGSRERLIETAFARETARLLGAVVVADDAGADPADRIATAFATALGVVRSHPLARHWLAVEPGDLLDALLADEAAVLRAGESFIAASIAGAEPGDVSRIRPVTRRLAELLVRLFAAFVLMPPPSVDLDDPAQIESFARELVAPLVVSVG